MRRRLAGLVLLVGALAGGSAAHATVRDLGPAAGSLLLTDGKRYVAVRTAAGAIAVRDLATGRRTVRPVPATCQPTALGGGQLLLSCRLPVRLPEGSTDWVLASGLTIDLVTGVTRRPPDVRSSELPVSASDVEVLYTGIGDAWLQLTADGYHFSYDSFRSRSGGRVVPGPTDRSAVVGLDRPGLVRRLCDPVRRPEDLDDYGSRPDPLTIAGSLAAGVDRPLRTAVVLQRCGHAPRIIRTCTRFVCSSIVLGRRTIAWVEHYGLLNGGCQVRVQHLRAGRPQGIARAIVRPDPCHLAMARDRLFAVADGRLLEVSTSSRRTPGAS